MPGNPEDSINSAKSEKKSQSSHHSQQTGWPWHSSPMPLPHQGCMQDPHLSHLWATWATPLHFLHIPSKIWGGAIGGEGSLKFGTFAWGAMFPGRITHSGFPSSETESPTRILSFLLSSAISLLVIAAVSSSWAQTAWLSWGILKAAPNELSLFPPPRIPPHPHPPCPCPLCPHPPCPCPQFPRPLLWPPPLLLFLLLLSLLLMRRQDVRTLSLGGALRLRCPAWHCHALLEQVSFVYLPQFHSLRWHSLWHMLPTH